MKKFKASKCNRYVRSAVHQKLAYPNVHAYRFENWKITAGVTAYVGSEV